MHPNSAVSLNYCQPSTVETPHGYHESLNIVSQAPFRKYRPQAIHPQSKLHSNHYTWVYHECSLIEYYSSITGSTQDIINFASIMIYNPVQSLEAAHSRAKPTNAKEPSKRMSKGQSNRNCQMNKIYQTMLKVAREKCSLQDWTMRLF